MRTEASEQTTDMRLNEDIKRALDELPVPYIIVKKRDHYFAVVEGFPRIIVANNSSRDRVRNVRNTVAEIKRIAMLTSKDNA